MSNKTLKRLRASLITQENKQKGCYFYDQCYYLHDQYHLDEISLFTRTNENQILITSAFKVNDFFFFDHFTYFCTKLQQFLSPFVFVFLFLT